MEVFGGISVFRHHHRGSAVEAVGVEDVGQRDGGNPCLSRLENLYSDRFALLSQFIDGILNLLLMFIELERNSFDGLLVLNLQTGRKVLLWSLLPVAYTYFLG